MSRNFEKSKEQVEYERVKSMSKEELAAEKENKRKLLKRSFKFFYLPFTLLMLTTTVCTFSNSVDSYWMAFEGGRPLSPDYVQQQWLFNKFVYALYSAVSWKWSILVQTLIVVCVYTFYLEYSKDKIKGIGLLCLFSCYFYSSYNLRPWIVSIVAFLFAYEFTKKEYKTAVQLIAVCACSVAVSNFESSFLPLFYCFIGVRLFDAVFVYKDQKLALKYFGYMALSVLFSLINPYGADAVLYLFDSVGKAKSMHVEEMLPIKPLSFESVKIAFTLYMVLWKLRKKSTLGEKICITVCAVLAACMSRNGIFLGLSCYSIMRKWVKSLNFWTSKEKKRVELNCFRMYSVALIALAVYFCDTQSYANANDMTVSEDTYSALLEHCDENTALYHFINLGGFLEMRGLPCAAMADCRPELLSDEFREDWLLFFDNGPDYVGWFVDKYDFDTILLKPYSRIQDAYLYRYLMDVRDDYELVHSHEEDFEFRIYWQPQNNYEYIFKKVESNI